MSTPDQATPIDNLFGADVPAQTPAPADPASGQAQPYDPAYHQPSQSELQPPPAPAPAAPPRESERMVPLAELIETRKRAQAAEAQTQQLIEALNRLNQPQPYPQPDPIDPAVDPELAFQALQTNFQRALVNERLNFSEDRAREKFGDEIVDQAFEAAKQAGYVQTFINRRDPYGEMVKWHQGQRAIQEIGDPAAYREKLAAQIRQQVLEELRSGKNAAAPQNLPPSLSRAGNANSSPELVTSDKDFFNSMFQRRPRQG